MERTMSVEDKIRRAEEIYNRRRENEYKPTNTRVRVDNSKSDQSVNNRLKKMIAQIIICMLVYLTFHYIINNNYIFSEDVRNKCEEILAYDISFGEMYKKISEAVISIQEKYNNIMNNTKENNEESNKNETNTEEQNLESDQQQNIEQDSVGDNTLENNENIEIEGTENTGEVINKQVDLESADENIGGAVDKIATTETNTEEEELTEEEQMKKDAEDIKSKINFIKPLNGTITSGFGWRNPTVSTVSKYHTGLDIAAKEGTDITSATKGKVILASSKGAYGNHLKIQVDDIIIIYAHCLSLEVQEGQEIVQGQVIAKVGSTGNSTGPHLHFEIRKDDRYVNPQLILDF